MLTPPKWNKCPHCNGVNGVHLRGDCAQKAIIQGAKDEFLMTIAAAVESRGWLLDRYSGLAYDALELGKDKKRGVNDP